MKNHFTIPLSLFFIGFIMLPFGASAQMKTLVDINKNYSGITKIEVTGGALEIAYEGNPALEEVSVNAFLESNNHEQDIIFVTVGDILKISHKVNNSGSGWRNMKTKGHIKITGPKEMDLEMRGGSGSVLVDNVKSELTTIQVGSGRITGKNISGEVETKAGSGSIQLSNIQGDVSGSVGSGSAKIEDILGNVKYSSGSGGITATNVQGLLSVSLSSGNAKLENIGELGALRLTSGNLNANNAGLGPDTSINGSSGNFKIKTPSDLREFNFHMKATSGNITVGNSRGGRSLTLDNGAPYDIKGSVTSGNISIEN
jgi:lia operon protein LiaG